MTDAQRRDKGLKTSTPFGLYPMDKSAIHKQALKLDISDSRMLMLMIEAMNDGRTVQDVIAELKSMAKERGTTMRKIIEEELEAARH